MDSSTWYSFAWLVGIGVFLGYGLYTWRLIRAMQWGKLHYSHLLLKVCLRLPMVLCLLWALRLPLPPLTERANTRKSELYFLIDISASMQVGDVAPNRLEKAKLEIKNILTRLPDTRCGLIAFADSARVICPPTNDVSAFVQTLSTLNALPSNTSAGTAFAPALRLALERFKASAVIRPDIQRAAILVSDGENFADFAPASLREWQLRRWSIFTLGIGTNYGGRIANGQGGFFYNPNGTWAISKREDATLQLIARQTQATHYEVSERKNEANLLAQQLAELFLPTLAEANANARSQRDNRYEWFVWSALALIVLDIVLLQKILSL